MAKAITIVPALGKYEHLNKCTICEISRPVTWYEADTEVAKMVQKVMAGKQLPPDGERMFFGPFCSIECAEMGGTYKVQGDDDEETP